MRADFDGRLEAGAGASGREPEGRDPGRDFGRNPGPNAGHEQNREAAAREAGSREAPGRVVGSPLPGTPVQGTQFGAGSTAGAAEGTGRKAAPPGRALATPSVSAEDSSAMQRAMGLLKQAAPFVARLLPLIEGNIGAAIGNLLSGHGHNAPPPQVTVDLAPVKNQMSDLQAQQTEFRSTLQEQTSGLRRVEDRLERVREATDRNTLEQQELMNDLKSMGHKVNRIALGLSILLLASIVINLYLYYYIRKALP